MFYLSTVLRCSTSYLSGLPLINEPQEKGRELPPIKGAKQSQVFHSRMVEVNDHRLCSWPVRALGGNWVGRSVAWRGAKRNLGSRRMKTGKAKSGECDDGSWDSDSYDHRLCKLARQITTTHDKHLLRCVRDSLMNVRRPCVNMHLLLCAECCSPECTHVASLKSQLRSESFDGTLFAC